METWAGAMPLEFLRSSSLSRPWLVPAPAFPSLGGPQSLHRLLRNAATSWPVWFARLAVPPRQSRVRVRSGRTREAARRRLDPCWFVAALQGRHLNWNLVTGDCPLEMGLHDAPVACRPLPPRGRSSKVRITLDQLMEKAIMIKTLQLSFIADIRTTTRCFGTCGGVGHLHKHATPTRSAPHGRANEDPVAHS
jgi:hypothetical protein